jgi:hypothetical protein
VSKNTHKNSYLLGLMENKQPEYIKQSRQREAIKTLKLLGSINLKTSQLSKYQTQE